MLGKEEAEKDLIYTPSCIKFTHIIMLSSCDGPPARNSGKKTTKDEKLLILWNETEKSRSLVVVDGGERGRRWQICSRRRERRS